MDDRRFDELARALDEDAGAALAAHARGGGIAVPMAAHLVVARN